MTSKILIIGSEGFIGKHAQAFFLNKGYEVFTIDVLDIIKENYIKVSADDSNFKQIFCNYKFDICINVSGAANVTNSFKDPLFDFNLNVFNVFKILEAIKLFNDKCKFVNLSSAAVYGNPDILPIIETSTILPISPYGFHKSISEIIVKEYYSVYKIQSISLRVFSVYGEYLKKQLFWDLYNKILHSSNDEIFLSGSGLETRDFIYVLDLLKALFLIINGVEFKGQAVNVANGEALTIKRVVEVFTMFVNPKFKVSFNNEIREGDPRFWESDITILKELGYSPDFTIEQGLNNYVKWLKNG